MTDTPPLDRIDAALARIDAALAHRARERDALARRHAALRAAMSEAAAALDVLPPAPGTR